MKKVNLFLAFALVITFMSGCKKDDESASSLYTISGIVMDSNDEPVKNGKVIIKTYAGSSLSMLNYCEDEELIFFTNRQGYFKAQIYEDCVNTEPVHLLVEDEEGNRVGDDPFQTLFIADYHQHLDSRGFNSPHALFYPDPYSFIANTIYLNRLSKSSFNMTDTLYFLLPPNAFESKGWHIKSIPLGSISNGFNFNFRRTLPGSGFFLDGSSSGMMHQYYVTDKRENFFGHTFDLPPYLPKDENRYSWEDDNPWIKNLQRLTHPHQNIGGENHIYLTVKKENGKIVVVEGQ